jgi:uncharacterized protein with HEPN domain
MLIGPLLGLFQDAATAVLVMTNEPDEEEFSSSRLTRQQVMWQLRIMSDTGGNLPPGARAQLAQIDWTGGAAQGMPIKAKDRCEHEAIWLGVRSLVAALLIWLGVCRRNLPEMFSSVP